MSKDEQCYDVGAIHELLTDGFDAPSLDALCQIYFFNVYNRFGRGMRKDEKITDLIDYCQRNPQRRFKELLDAVQQEHQEVFKQHGPYLKPCDDDSIAHGGSSREPREILPPSGDKIDIENRIEGNVVGQVVVGISNVPLQHISTLGDLIIGPTLTKAGQTALQRKLADLKTQIEAEAPPAKKISAIERVEELVEAITAQKPDLDTIGYIKRWFAKNIPLLAEPINSIITDPTTSKLITTADEALGAEFKRRFG